MNTGIYVVSNRFAKIGVFGADSIRLALKNGVLEPTWEAGRLGVTKQTKPLRRVSDWMKTKRPTKPDAEAILGGYFPVLDHGFISLVDYMGSDEDIERAARVSYGHGTRRRSATRGLVRYLRRHRHTTPTEMVELKFHCCMPLFVARQWIRHRTASVNEMSGRYSLLPLLFYTPSEKEFGLQSKQNNQGRASETAGSSSWNRAVEAWNRSRSQASDHYRAMLEADVAREIARIDLPLSTYTQWYWKIDLHNLLHFLTLRVDPHAQWEIRAYAEVMAGIVQRVAPLSYEAWVDYDLCGERMSHMEMEVLRSIVNPTASFGLKHGSTGQMSQEDLLGQGLSKREVRELVDKLSARDRPDFTLDLDHMRPAAEIEEEMARAVPQIDP